MLSVFITFFVDTIMECFKKTQQAEYDHNIIGAALELLSQMLSTHAEYPFLWPEKTRMFIYLKSFLLIMRQFKIWWFSSTH